MKIALVEDMDRDARRVEELLDRYAHKHDVECQLERYVSGDAFLSKSKMDCDAVFMDIEMPGLNGMETARQLRRQNADVPLVFLTNLKQYALKGYQVEAMDFLVKPVSSVAFFTMMDRIRRRMAKSSGDEIVLRCDGTLYRVRVEDIIYLEVAQHYIIYHTSARDYSFWGSLAKEYERLPQGKFAFCSSCYLVNLGNIIQVQGDEVLVKGASLKLSRAKRTAFLQTVLEYVNGGSQS